MKITDLCTGCRACEQRCPTHCISMKPDKEGFLCANVDDDMCIKCGLCVKICPQNKSILHDEPSEVLAVRLKDNETLYKSASGGAFAGIAQKVIEDCGYVFGASYDSKLRVFHKGVSNLTELKELQSSKYVQSDTLETYSEVKNLLKNGKFVLYSGVPCQIEGLKSYLGKAYNNLLTIDLICHGVPSQKLFSHYISWLENQNKNKILYYDFRDKKKGWGLGYKSKTKTKTKTKYLAAELDPYYLYFLKGYTYRECCYSCKYAKKNRCGDITIGDYWGIKEEHPSFFSTKGVSLILINTEKGKQFWSKISESFYIQKSTLQQAVKYNSNLNKATTRPALRDTIYDGIDDMNVNTYFNSKFKIPFNLKARVKEILPVALILFLKKHKK